MNQFRYQQADVSRLISQLRVKIQPRYRNLANPGGPEGRLNRLRTVVSALIKYERLEVPYVVADEARGYAERLISEAIRHGDRHRETMDIANYWLTEKQLIHKLFNVLVPRFNQYQTAYTALYKAPLKEDKMQFPFSLLELKGNPFPPIIFDSSRNKNLIHNVLLDEARKEHRKMNYANIVEKVSQSEKQASDKRVAKDAAASAPSQMASEVTEGEELLKCDTTDDVTCDTRTFDV